MQSIFLFLSFPKRLIYDPEHKMIEHLLRAASRPEINNWLHDDLHKWTWYLNLLLTIVPVYIICKVIDRRRLLELVVYGLFIAVAATFLDCLGLAFNLWDYPDRLLPIEPRLLPVNLVGLPFFYILAYQYFRPWSQFVLANFVLAALFAFVGEPLFIWLNLYDPVAWHPAYSFPIYIALAILARCFTDFLVKKDLPYRANSADDH